MYNLINMRYLLLGEKAILNILFIPCLCKTQEIASTNE